MSGLETGVVGTDTEEISIESQDSAALEVRRELYAKLAEENRTHSFEQKDHLVTDDVDEILGMGGQKGEEYEMRQQIYRRLRAGSWRTEMTAASGTRVKVKFPPKSEAREHVKLKMFCAGGMAGAVAKTVGAPLSRATIEMQTQATLGKESKSLIQVMTKTVQKDGVRGLLKGNMIDILRSVPMTGLSFLFYGVTKSVRRPTLPASCDSGFQPCSLLPSCFVSPSSSRLGRPWKKRRCSREQIIQSRKH